MKMTRHYFISSNLDDLERFELDLERSGIPRQQIHVLTLDDTAAENRHQLHEEQALMKRDLLRSGMFGAVLGIVLAALVVGVAVLGGWTRTGAGWMPFIFLALIVLGFCAWEGGLWGVQNLNARFRRFESMLVEGRHVFFVDLEPGRQERVLQRIVDSQPETLPAGRGHAAPRWLLIWQMRLRRFLVDTMP